MKIFSFLTCCIIIISLSVSIIGCKSSTDLNPNSPPVATFTYAPSTIDTSIIVSFNAMGSIDEEDSPELLAYSWDFEGQQQWTTPIKSPLIDYRYSKPGTYTVTLKVIDTEGWTGKASETIIVYDTIINK